MHQKNLFKQSSPNNPSHKLNPRASISAKTISRIKNTLCNLKTPKKPSLLSFKQLPWFRKGQYRRIRRVTQGTRSPPPITKTWYPAPPHLRPPHQISLTRAPMIRAVRSTTIWQSMPWVVWDGGISRSISSTFTIMALQKTLNPQRNLWISSCRRVFGGQYMEERGRWRVKFRWSLT